jgi:hypothetical protein
MSVQHAPSWMIAIQLSRTKWDSCMDLKDESFIKKVEGDQLVVS